MRLASALLTLALAAPVSAQDKPQDRQPAAAAPAVPKAPVAPRISVPLRIELVISRYEGNRKVSSEPFTLLVNAIPPPDPGAPPAHPVRLRMGAEVPLPNGGTKPIGTNIDCTGFLDDRDRYRLEVTVEGSSAFGDDRPQAAAGAAPQPPIFRSFRLTNSAVLRDGQTVQFASATDSVSGQTLKVDVTLNVLK
jgi:hypothetical protein